MYSPLECFSSNINEDSSKPDLIHEHAGEGFFREALPTHLNGQADNKLDDQADDKHNSELDENLVLFRGKDVGHLDWESLSLLDKEDTHDPQPSLCPNLLPNLHRERELGDEDVFDNEKNRREKVGFNLKGVEIEGN